MYVLSCLFTACTNISGKNESNTAFDPSTQPIPEKIIEAHEGVALHNPFDEIGEFSYGLAIVRKNDKYGFANQKGREIVPTIYDKIEPFNGFSAEVTLKGETYLIDGSGHRIIEEY